MIMVFFTRNKRRNTREAFVVTLRRACSKLWHGQFLSEDEQFAIDTYFYEGYTMMSNDEYRKRVITGDFKNVNGGIFSVDENTQRVNIHTRNQTVVS